MNDRINELVGKAGATELGADLYGGEYIGAIRADFLERFAGLIVAACIDEISKEPTRTEYISGQSFKYIQLGETIATIQDHFGIKNETNSG